eukprot:Gb_39799 [translate_table: standard]
MKSQAIHGHTTLNVLDDEIFLIIFEKLQDSIDRKSWSLVCKHFCYLEATCRKRMQLMRSELLPRILQRYSELEHLDLSLCPQITDESLGHVARISGNHLLSINLSKLNSFTHLGLARLFENCQSVVELDLSNCTNIGDAAAVALAHARNLQSLELVKCKQISDIGLGCIAEGCSKLQSLNLTWCVRITDHGVELVAAKCKELRNLNLSYLQITNKCFASITYLYHLENLALVGCLDVGDDGLACLKNGCKSLQRLDISKCHGVSCAGIISLASGSTALHQLTLAYSISITNALLSSFQNFGSLQTIRFDGCLISSTGLECVGKSCGSLRELSLHKCSGVTDGGVSALVACCRELNKLDLSFCRDLTDVAISAIAASCRYLSCLKMESCYLVTERSLSKIGDGCPFLKELDLTNSSLNNAGLRSISRCSELITLKLGFCQSISDEGIAHIGVGCSNLEELDFYRSVGVGDAGLAAIANGCSRLKIINLSYCVRVTDDALKSLSQLQKLPNLEIRGCSRISSAGLSAIALGCKRIVELDVKRCYHIDDVGISAMALSCQNLRQINVSYCSISDAGLLALASISCLQSMKLVHLRNVSMDGFASALLACESLKKLKLLKCLKFRLPHDLIEHLEARGCSIRWMDKPLVI